MYFLKRINEFYNRNLFEKLIVYILGAQFVAIIYSEAILGEAVFYNPKISQWVFYVALLIDYLVNFKKVITMRININYASIFAFFVLGLVFQGLVVGIESDNPWFLVFNDAVPLIMIAANILRMQSKNENPNISFDFLFKFIIIISFLTVAISLSLSSIGYIELDKATTSIHQLCLAVAFAALFISHRVSPIYAVLFLIVFGASLDGLNRTTMVFIGLLVFVLLIRSVIRTPQKGVLLMMLIPLIASGIFFTLSPESQTYKRITELSKMDFSRRTGSIGERQLEWDSINRELKKRGTTQELFGLGFGGTFTMHFTHAVKENYGHAHYSWAWFKMRFGILGFFYLLIFIIYMNYNLFRGMRNKEAAPVFVAMLCTFSNLYLLTFVNAIFLLSGLQFMYLSNKHKKID